jgi:hypothetical protein
MTICNAKEGMILDSVAGVHEPAAVLPGVESNAAPNDAGSDDTDSGGSDSEMDDEELDNWLLPTYKPKFWSKHPMKEALTAPWDLPISDADVEKLKTGFKSKNMDDKWDFLVEDPDKNGNISLHIIRTWCREPCWILHIMPKPSSTDGGGAKIHGITWEGKRVMGRSAAEQAQKEAVILCRGHLRCTFEALPEYPIGTFYDPNAYTKSNAK